MFPNDNNKLDENVVATSYITGISKPKSITFEQKQIEL